MNKTRFIRPKMKVNNPSEAKITEMVSSGNVVQHSANDQPISAKQLFSSYF